MYGFNQVGNGSTSIPKLLTSGHRLTEVNIRLLHQSDLESLEDLDTNFQAESLLCWAKMAVRVNAYINWSCYAYNSQGTAHSLPEVLRNRLQELEIVLHNQDNREHDIFDSDDYYQFQVENTQPIPRDSPMMIKKLQF